MKIIFGSDESENTASVRSFLGWQNRLLQKKIEEAFTLKGDEKLDTLYVHEKGLTAEFVPKTEGD